jgi:hypothetical protein
MKPMNPNEIASTIKMAELTIIDAMIFQEVISRTESTIPTIGVTLISKPIKVSLAETWEQILGIDYQPIFEIALKLVKAIPSAPQVEEALLILAREAQKIASSRALLRHDLMGRIYHLLLMRDIAKYHATYYTSVPAAYLLARFSLEAPNSEWKVDWTDLKSIGKFRLADLACGSGTLLSAAYTAILDNHVTAAASQDLDANTNELHHILLEDVLKGFDVLSYAAHLTAVTLALHNPASLFKSTGIYSVPLKANSGKPRLGSIDLLEDTTLIPTVSLAGEVTMPEKQGLDSKEKVAVDVKDMDFIIMNPPFTRSVGGNLLFGALPPEQRKELQKALAALLKKKGYSGIGQAGLAAVFVTVADNCLKSGGRLAIVVPRSIMSGVSWKKIRTLLSEDYHVELIVSSHQAPKDWNFSENTDLSEALLVARKKTGADDEPPVKTIFANLWRKPENEMESIVAAGKLVELNRTLQSHTTNYDVLENANAAAFQIAMGKHFIGEAYSVNPDVLAETLDTWGQLAPFAQTQLNRIAYNLLQHGKLNSIPLVFPIRPLEEVVETIGPDRSQVHACFTVTKIPTQYRALWEHDSDYITKVALNSNRFLQPKPGSALLAQKLWDKGTSQLLLAERIRLNTNKATAIFVDNKVLSNVWWPVVLKAIAGRSGKFTREQHEMVQSVWLNSSFGLLCFLSLRQDTEGPWIGMKKEILGRLPLLYVNKLNKQQIEALEKTYQELSTVSIPPIPVQFQLAIKKEGWRYELDKRLVDIISGNPVDLTWLYEMIAREPIISLKPLS